MTWHNDLKQTGMRQAGLVNFRPNHAFHHAQSTFMLVMSLVVMDLAAVFFIGSTVFVCMYSVVLSKPTMHE